MMQDLREQACWITLVFESGFTTRVVNDILVSWCYQRQRNVQAFFAADSKHRAEVCSLNPDAVQKLEQAQEKLAAQAFLVEQLADASISLLTLFDNEYPRVLKSTLKRNQTPPLLFYMGDVNILRRQTIAIIGSRHAGERGLAFTRCVAHALAGQGVNVISGNARGVDRSAYEGAISADGYTTVVLPHGIRTVSRVKMRELLPKIQAGKVFVCSQFHPDAPWMVHRAMERNKVVTGLAQIVIVAESDSKGGTWDGANGALEQKRPLYVCQMDDSMPPGNASLLKRGANALRWPAENVEEVLSPLIQTCQEGYHRQASRPMPPDQLSLLAVTEPVDGRRESV
jgi:DNA processing protein